MSSVTSYIAQGAYGRTKYFRAVASVTSYLVNTGYTVSAVMTQAQFTAAASSSGLTISSGDLLKDMGGEIRIVNSVGSHIASYRSMQVQHGVATEGVDGDSTTNYNTVWVQVWDAVTPGNVDISRLG